MFSKLSIKNKLIVVMIFLVTIIFFSVLVVFGLKNLFSSSFITNLTNSKNIVAEEKNVVQAQTNIEGKQDDEAINKENSPEENMQEPIKFPNEHTKKNEYVSEMPTDPLIPKFLKIGTDIEPGIYKLTCLTEDYAHYKITNGKGNNNINILEENVFSSFAYIELKNNQGLYLVDSDITPLSESSPYIPENNIYINAEYKVGFDMPEGTYSITSQGNIGSIQISTSPSSKDIFFQQYISGEVTINVKDGQYLTISMVTLRPL